MFIESKRGTFNVPSICLLVLPIFRFISYPRYESLAALHSKGFSIRTMYLRSLSWIGRPRIWGGMELERSCRALLIFNAIQFLAFSIGKSMGTLACRDDWISYLPAAVSVAQFLFVDARGSVVSCSVVRTRYCQKPLVESENFLATPMVSSERHSFNAHSITLTASPVFNERAQLTPVTHKTVDLNLIVLH